jgi:hypothetical protein
VWIAAAISRFPRASAITCSRAHSTLQGICL